MGVKRRRELESTEFQEGDQQQIDGSEEPVASILRRGFANRRTSVTLRRQFQQ